MRLGIVSIDRVGASLNVRVGERTRIEPDNLMRLLAEDKAASFTPNGVLRVKIGGAGAEVAGTEVLAAAHTLLRRLGA